MSISWQEHRGALLGLIMLVGLALRVTGLHWGQAYSYFGQGDGIAAYSMAVDYGSGEARAQYIGQPKYNDQARLPGPLWAMFCFLCLRFGGSIYGVLWGIILLNTALIYLVYVLAERTLDTRAGLWAALFAATAPWPVYYSVGVYNPDIMGFLGAVLCLALWQAMQHQHARSIFWVPLILLAMPQVHMSGLQLIPAVVVLLFLSPARVNLVWLLGGVAAGLALYVPYIRGEMANGWQNTHGMFSGKGGFSWSCLKVFSLPPGLLMNWVPQWARNMAEYKEMSRAYCGSFAVVLLLGIASAVMTVLALLGAFLRVKSAGSGKLGSVRQCFEKSPGILFLAVIVLVALSFSLVSGKPFHTRYFLVLMAPFLALAGGGAAAWMGRIVWPQKTAWRRVFVISAAITVGANLWLVAAMYHYQGRRIDEGEEFVASWRNLEGLYQSLKAEAGKGHSVRVDDTAYLADLARGGHGCRDAYLINWYVTLREKEAMMAASQQKPPMVFRLKRAGTGNGAPRGYCAKGIVLEPCGRDQGT
jgi:hypothetical protein